jgi:hypothetical protein
MLIETLLSMSRDTSNEYAPNFLCSRILMCAPSNAAVDEVALRLLELPTFKDKEGAIVRIGKSSVRAFAWLVGCATNVFFLKKI